MISGFYFSLHNGFFHALPERRVCCVFGKLLHLGGEEFSKVFSYLNLILYQLRTKSQHCQIPGGRRESHSCKTTLRDSNDDNLGSQILTYLKLAGKSDCPYDLVWYHYFKILSWIILFESFVINSRCYPAWDMIYIGGSCIIFNYQYKFYLDFLMESYCIFKYL